MNEITNLPIQNTLQALGAKTGAQESAKGASFGDILQNTIRTSLQTLRAGETASAQAVTGQANLQSVVGAITQAELTLETVVAVRDRAVSAFQELMRMQV